MLCYVLLYVTFRANTSHDCVGGLNTQNFPTKKPSTTTATTTVVGTFVKFMHYMTDLTLNQKDAINSMISVGIYVLTLVD